MKYLLLIFSFLFYSLVNAQFLSNAETVELGQKAMNINVDASYSNGNWTPLLNEIKDKRIVLLGEPNHGSKEVFVSRIDLIKALHEQLGYSVILFESGIGELAVLDLEKEKRNAKQMTYGLVGGWRTKEHEALMAYIQENNISIAGFDVQRTGGTFKNLLANEMEKLEIDSNAYNKLEAQYTIAKNKLGNRKTSYDTISTSVKQLITAYKNINTLLQNEGNGSNSESLKWVQKTVDNRILYLEYMLQFKADNDWNKRWAARDLAMANNIKWLINTVYQAEKVIVVAHNFHISKHNEKEQVMGEFLKEHFASEMFSLGVFAGEGTFYGNYGNAKELIPADPSSLDIKHIIQQLDGPIHFLPIPKNQSSKNSWLFKDIVINDTFIDLSNSNQLILAKNFDGLLFIDKISLPEK